MMGVQHAFDVMRGWNPYERIVVVLTAVAFVGLVWALTPWFPWK